VPFQTVLPAGSAVQDELLVKAAKAGVVIEVIAGGTSKVTR
jgi:hypothetical protein